MAKRKPPSHRPELQMDDTARAIARLRDASREGKEGDAPPAIEAKKGAARLDKGITTRKVNAPPTFPITKRTKKG